VRVEEARAVARRWVEEYGAGLPGFAGAFLSGSTAWLPSGAEVAATSDVDVMVVLTGEQAPPKLGKFRHDGVLLEITFLTWSDIGPVEQVLSSYHLAASLRGDTVLADPTGRLGELQAVTAAGFARPEWIRRRCEDAERRIVNGLTGLDDTLPWSDQVTRWLFPTGVTTHVLLTAGLRNPTIRLRYVAARELLHQHGREDFHEELLVLLGCAGLTPDEVAGHLDAMAEIFDTASGVVRTPFFFASDISAAARPVAVDGGRDLIARGLHREAVFWIVATSARCLTILTADAPDRLPEFEPAFDVLLAALGIGGPADLRRRGDEVLAFLPRLRTVAKTISG
jgi:hypothetical protein